MDCSIIQRCVCGQLFSCRDVYVYACLCVSMCDQGGDLPGVTSLVPCDSLCTGADITESELCTPHCGLFDYHLLGVAKPAQEEKK